MFAKTKSDYPVRDIIDRARRGRQAIYPFAHETARFSIYGTRMYQPHARFATLDDIEILPPQFTPQRLQKAVEILREPIYHDVSTSATVGGFKTVFPLIQSSMGSQDDWNRAAPFSARACAELGLICGIGENIAATWGYDKRHDPAQPCLKDRILAYLKHTKDGVGGIVVQQNEEDAYDELWNKIYSDKDLEEYIWAGMIGYEIKGGQGAKAGMGGEKIVDRATAKRLKQKFAIYPDPDVVDSDFYERHSSPDIFTHEILERRIMKLKNDYPRLKIWYKTGPYRDLNWAIDVATDAGADCIVIDGKEGGTGMSPSVALQDLGLPTLSCLKYVRDARKRGNHISMVVSGRLYNGAHLVKAMALGANAVAMGRPFLLASYAYPMAEHFIEYELYRFSLLRAVMSTFVHPDERSVQFVKSFVDSVLTEAKLLTSAVGKYSLSNLSAEDIGALRRDIADMLDISYIY